MKTKQTDPKMRSPLPWRVGKYSRLEDSRGKIIADPTHDPREDEGSKLNAHNAAFIVRACNEYEELMGSNRALRNHLAAADRALAEAKAHAQRLADALTKQANLMQTWAGWMLDPSHSFKVSIEILTAAEDEAREALAQWEASKQ